MQKKTAKTDGQHDADSEINDRLVEHLKANAIRTGRPEAANDLEPKRGFFGETYALFSLVGMMVVAYVYTLLVGNEA